MREQEVAPDRQAEIRRQGQRKERQSGEQTMHSACFRAEIDPQAAADDPCINRGVSVHE